MRTTLTLDDDIADQLTRLAEQSHQPFKNVVNDTLRRGLAGQTGSGQAFDYTAHQGHLLPGIDPRKLNEIAWELDEERLKR